MKRALIAMLWVALVNVRVTGQPEPGEIKGDIMVQLGPIWANVPISATLKPQRGGLLRLLRVETPFEKFTTSNGGKFRQWTDLVARTFLDAHTAFSRSR
jgi:hypothetical protein